MSTVTSRRSSTNSIELITSSGDFLCKCKEQKLYSGSQYVEVMSMQKLRTRGGLWSLENDWSKVGVVFKSERNRHLFLREQPNEMSLLYLNEFPVSEQLAVNSSYSWNQDGEPFLFFVCSLLVTTLFSAPGTVPGIL